MTIESPAFQSGGTIPNRFTCFGDNRSPPLIFRDVPPGTQSLTLMMDQRHTPRDVVTLWVLFNINATVAGMEEGAVAPPGAHPGRNHWGQIGYHGPSHEGEHVYFFRLFALDCKLYLPDGADGARVVDAMGGHVLAKAEMWGTYIPPTETAPAPGSGATSAPGGPSPQTKDTP
ncbi:MAG: YbhB/YbcL family Raf kinase inhibitor-like protein [Opitutaceae bacterium]|nr:YbhB/YbcL family Raf kinase inhibitor-like protein [Opitutaceae bacterium]